MPDSPRFVLDNGDLAISGLIAQGHHTADPQPFAFGGSDLVAVRSAVTSRECGRVHATQDGMNVPSNLS
jgi:hypothetical protein